jgi:hypothetical protein
MTDFDREQEAREEMHMGSVAAQYHARGLTDKKLAELPIRDQDLMEISAQCVHDDHDIGYNPTDPDDGGITMCAMPTALVYRVVSELLTFRFAHHIDEGAEPYDQDKDDTTFYSPPGYL